MTSSKVFLEFWGYQISHQFYCLCPALILILQQEFTTGNFITLPEDNLPLKITFKVNFQGQNLIFSKINFLHTWVIYYKGPANHREFLWNVIQTFISCCYQRDLKPQKFLFSFSNFKNFWEWEQRLGSRIWCVLKNPRNSRSE